MVDSADGPYDMASHDGFGQDFGWDYVIQEYARYAQANDRLATPFTDHLTEHGLVDACRQQIRDIFRLTPTRWRGETSAIPQEPDLTSFIADQAIDWLETRRWNDPFLLTLAFVQRHMPLIDEPSWAAFYAGSEIKVPEPTPAQVPNATWDAHRAKLDEHSQMQIMDEDSVRNGIRHYKGMVSLIDQRIGDVMTALDKLG